MKFYGEENGTLCGISDKCLIQENNSNYNNINIEVTDNNNNSVNTSLISLIEEDMKNTQLNSNTSNSNSNNKKEETYIVVPICWTTSLPCCESCDVVTSSNPVLHQYIGWENDNW